MRADSGLEKSYQNQLSSFCQRVKKIIKDTPDSIKPKKTRKQGLGFEIPTEVPTRYAGSCKHLQLNINPHFSIFLEMSWGLYYFLILIIYLRNYGFDHSNPWANVFLAFYIKKWARYMILFSKEKDAHTSLQNERCDKSRFFVALIMPAKTTAVTSGAWLNWHILALESVISNTLNLACQGWNSLCLMRRMICPGIPKKIKAWCKPLDQQVWLSLKYLSIPFFSEGETPNDVNFKNYI